ncbi:copper chaperone CopZ [Aliibacillus thermotolerans]|uniref:Copper chaperone CopZ n=1 Tax=Aliibacillus thermotolerans TaxID=1834418 RepID=A0ABW0U2F7_9BACI|nr:copper chaperone CopZ [Aliibacillus thermotolerans]MDA3129415.1 copper chaperone CopZ [Aliibacillus thermotolerans]
MKTETIQVKGMSCDHCVKAVEGSVSKLSGVSKVNVNLSEGTVTVSYDERKTSHEEIVETIDDQGYDVVAG